MSPWRTYKVAWEGLTLNKVRSFLTTLGVIIGVAAVIVMLAVSAGAEAEIAEQINSLGANLIVVMPSMGRGGFGAGSGPPPGLTYDDLVSLEQKLTGINGISAEQSTTQDVKGGTTTLEGVGRRDFQANTRLGATFALPLARQHNPKLTWSSGVSTRIGGDFDNFALTYLYNW